MAAIDLTTTANVKAWLGIKQGQVDDDAILDRLVTSYSSYVQQWLNRTIKIKSYTENRSGTGGQVIVCSAYPLVSVSSVVVNNLSIQAAANSTQTGYTFDNVGVYLTGCSFTKGRNNVQLSYSAGFATVPLELEQAVIELIALRFRERDRIGHASKSLGGETVSFITKDFPDSVLTILNNYKKVISL